MFCLFFFLLSFLISFLFFAIQYIGGLICPVGYSIESYQGAGGCFWKQGLVEGEHDWGARVERRGWEEWARLGYLTGPLMSAWPQGVWLI